MIHSGGRRLLWLPIRPLSSVQDYNQYVLNALPDWIRTSHALIFQWDGFVLNPSKWLPDFLDCAYVGAPWPEMYARPDRRVGNGGFSLRTLRLMRAIQKMGPWDGTVAEDRVIAIKCAEALEQKFGFRFASPDMARQFSVEHLTLPHFSDDPNVPVSPTFGFHGFFNFHLAMNDHELINAIDDFMQENERRSILSSWSATALLLNLKLHHRHDMVKLLTQRMAIAVGLPGGASSQEVLDAISRMNQT